MKRTALSKISVIVLAMMLMTIGLSGCKMNLPDTSKIGPEGGAEADEADGGAEEDSEGGLTLEDVLAGESGSVENDTAVVEDSNFETDVTAGTVEGGSYYLAASINDDTNVYVDAPEVVLKDQKAANASDAKDKSGDLEKARLAYLTAYYEGDESSAKEDLAEYGKFSLTSGQSAALKNIYGELGKIFAQFDITIYDLTAPKEADDTFVSFDIFSSSNEPFNLDLTFDGDNLTDVNVTYDGDLS